MAHVARALLVGLFLMALVACGGKSTGYVPVDSPIMKYEPPDKEDLIEGDEEDVGGDEADEGGDWVDEMEDELEKEGGQPADKQEGSKAAPADKKAGGSK